jgi:RNA polymerase sigma-70 factor (ECF subfamily)
MASRGERQPDEGLDRRDMRELAAGSHRALERLYDRHSPRLAGFFWRMGAGAAEMDELVQDVFVRLWKHGANWRGDGRLSTYLFGIARSAWQESRSAARRPADAAAGAAGAGGRTEADRPDRELERRELGREIGEALAELPEGLRDVFSLATAGDLKYREIAEVLGIPVGTVKSRMAAAEEKLRERLSRYVGG